MVGEPLAPAATRVQVWDAGRCTPVWKGLTEVLGEAVHFSDSVFTAPWVFIEDWVTGRLLRHRADTSAIGASQVASYPEFVRRGQVLAAIKEADQIFDDNGRAAPEVGRGLGVTQFMKAGDTLCVYGGEDPGVASVYAMSGSDGGGPRHILSYAAFELDALPTFGARVVSNIAGRERTVLVALRDIPAGGDAFIRYGPDHPVKSGACYRELRPNALNRLLKHALFEPFFRNSVKVGDAYFKKGFLRTDERRWFEDSVDYILQTPLVSLRIVLEHRLSYPQAIAANDYWVAKHRDTNIALPYLQLLDAFLHSPKLTSTVRASIQRDAVDLLRQGQLNKAQQLLQVAIERGHTEHKGR